MKLDISSYPAFYINLDDDLNRKESTQKILKKLFKSVNRIAAYKGYRRPTDGQADLAEQQARSFHKAVTQTKTPFIVFEDDIAIHQYKGIIEVPDDADAVYLGGSFWGRPDGISKHITTDIPGIVKCLTMSSMHAVLFLNQNLVNEYAKRLFAKQGICDAVLCDMIIEGNYNFYAVQPVMFYQNSALGGQEKLTKINDYVLRTSF